MVTFPAPYKGMNSDIAPYAMDKSQARSLINFDTETDLGSIYVRGGTKIVYPVIESIEDFGEEDRETIISRSISNFSREFGSDSLNILNFFITKNNYPLFFIKKTVTVNVNEPVEESSGKYTVTFLKNDPYFRDRAKFFHCFYPKVSGNFFLRNGRSYSFSDGNVSYQESDTSIKFKITLDDIVNPEDIRKMLLDVGVFKMGGKKILPSFYSGESESYWEDPYDEDYQISHDIIDIQEQNTYPLQGLINQYFSPHVEMQHKIINIGQKSIDIFYSSQSYPFFLIGRSRTSLWGERLPFKFVNNEGNYALDGNAKNLFNIPSIATNIVLEQENTYTSKKSFYVFSGEVDQQGEMRGTPLNIETKEAIDKNNPNSLDIIYSPFGMEDLSISGTQLYYVHKEFSAPISTDNLVLSSGASYKANYGITAELGASMFLSPNDNLPRYLWGDGSQIVSVVSFKGFTIIVCKKHMLVYHGSSPESQGFKFFQQIDFGVHNKEHLALFNNQIIVYHNNGLSIITVSASGLQLQADNFPLINNLLKKRNKEDVRIYTDLEKNKLWIHVQGFGCFLVKLYNEFVSCSLWTGDFLASEKMLLHNNKNYLILDKMLLEYDGLNDFPDYFSGSINALWESPDVKEEVTSRKLKIDYSCSPLFEEDQNSFARISLYGDKYRHKPIVKEIKCVSKGDINVYPYQEAPIYNIMNTTTNKLVSFKAEMFNPSISFNVYKSEGMFKLNDIKLIGKTKRGG